MLCEIEAGVDTRTGIQPVTSRHWRGCGETGRRRNVSAFAQRGKALCSMFRLCVSIPNDRYDRGKDFSAAVSSLQTHRGYKLTSDVRNRIFRPVLWTKQKIPPDISRKTIFGSCSSSIAKRCAIRTIRTSASGVKAVGSSSGRRRCSMVTQARGTISRMRSWERCTMTCCGRSWGTRRCLMSSNTSRISVRGRTGDGSLAA